MKAFAAIGALALMFALSSSSVDAQATPIDIGSGREYFAELRELGALDGGRLWGRVVSGPMLFVDAATRTVVANESDAAGLLRSENGVWVGRLPQNINAANTAVELGGKRWSLVLWPVSDSRYTRRRLLMHESFHRIQNELGIPAGDPSNTHLAQLEGRIWTRFEWRALTEALLRTGEMRKRALTDALIFRAKRRAVFAGAAEGERQLELNEGLAEYTGLVLSGLPRSSLPDRAAVQLAQTEPQESFVRSFAYASGPAYGLLLDAAGKPWRNRIRPSSDLSAMAAGAYGIASIDEGKAESLIDRYTGSRMVADERSRNAKRIENETRLRGRFIDGPTLTLPVGGSFAFSFDPNGATPIPGVGTVYASSRITDDWGVLEVSSGGVLFIRKDGGPITGVVVAAPIVSADGVKGDGWKLTLAPGWTATDGSRKGDFVIAQRRN